jgi:cysteinyl-tRNA synthetase
LRFFLLYTHYRKKLNFTKEKFIKSCDYIDLVRDKINYLMKNKSNNAPLSGETSPLIHSIADIFAKNMDDDLGFGKAIDGIAAVLDKLIVIKDKTGINKTEIEKLVNIIKKINTVAGVIF